MKSNCFLQRLFVLLLCFHLLCLLGCSKQNKITDPMRTTEEIPVGWEPTTYVIDGNNELWAYGTPIDTDVLKHKLSDPHLGRRIGRICGEGCYLADDGFYMLGIRDQCILYTYYSVPIIRNELIVGFVRIVYYFTEGEFREFYSEGFHIDYEPEADYILLLNTILKENPGEKFLYFQGGYLLDSHNEVHFLTDDDSVSLTILNQDTLYSNYYVEACTISSDIFREE